MTGTAPQDERRRLPSIDRLLRSPEIERLEGVYGRERVRVQARRELDRLRADLGGATPVDLEFELAALPSRVGQALGEAIGAPLERVINATGVLLHTNLGRAPLPRDLAAELPPLLDAYLDLELDLETGRRGDRNRRVGSLLAAACGAEAGLAVNNCAGALVLILSTYARGREVVVSRGELVEIGGSFRIPDILEAAGAILVEVGTTNRTRIADYERAIGPRTALLLKVHPSNYRLSGFVEEAGAAAIADLARRRGLVSVYDEGSGLLSPHPAPQLADHPSFQEVLEAGCDLVCGSGDKLLGGPQAGLVAGSAERVEPCRRHPFYRALRPDRAALAGLDLVLRRRLTGGPLPLDRMWPEPRAHRRRLEAVATAVGARVAPAEAYLGGGAAPDRPIPGEALALPPDETLLERLRTGRPAVVGYIRQDRLVLDLRTVDPADDEALVAAVAAAAG